ncbi:MAG TPA: cell division protein FtsL [Clostridiales bacterium]|nr:cell division protein FtsL [Clostridiales bacterium]
MIARPLFLMLLTLILAVGYIYCDALMQAKGRDLTNLKNQTAAVERENAALKTEIAKLSSAQRIEEVARRELGMVQAGEADIVYYTAAKATSDSPDSTEKTKSAEGYGIFSVFKRLFPGS